MSELKPCPFCGNKLIKKCSQQLPGLSSPAFWFKCDCCGAESGPSKNRPESITGWNFRAESPELATLREQVKVLREALEWLVNEMDCRDDDFGGCLFTQQDFKIARDALEQT